MEIFAVFIGVSNLLSAWQTPNILTNKLAFLIGQVSYFFVYLKLVYHMYLHHSLGFSADLMQMFSPLIKDSAVQLTNGVTGRKKHQLLASFVGDDYVHSSHKEFAKV